MMTTNNPFHSISDRPTGASVRFRFLLSLLVLLPLLSYGQNIEQYIFSSQGNYEQSATMTLSWTLGENFIETLQTENGNVTQGFQQPFVKLVEVLHPDLVAFDAMIYPNPTGGVLNVSIQNNDEIYDMEVFDITGRILLQKKSSDPQSELDLSQYSSGNYFLRITDDKGTKTSLFEIVKL